MQKDISYTFVPCSQKNAAVMFWLIRFAIIILAVSLIELCCLWTGMSAL